MRKFDHGFGSGLLLRAFGRFHDHVFKPKRAHPQLAAGAYGSAAGGAPLHELHVEVMSANETLALGVDERYSLTVETTVGFGSMGRLHAATVWGALHGLETFSQLTIRTVGDGTTVTINSSYVLIEDAPRFPWRGIMIDTARHWHPISSIHAMIDSLSFNRMNVLHWHITDAQSFPLKTKAFSKLADGAYGGAGSTLTYDAADVKGIVAYAKDRGVRVVPEIDNPGHSASWLVGYPEIGVPTPDGYWSLLDPTNEQTYALLEGLFTELAAMFEDEYVHVGCDEVDFEALNESAPVVAYMQRRGIPRTGRGFKRLV